MRLTPWLAALVFLLLASCTTNLEHPGAGAQDQGATDGHAATADGGLADSATSPDAGCSTATCNKPGHGCVAGACVADCRYSTATPCASGLVCDFTDGKCRPTGSPCLLPGKFESCPGSGLTLQCGPGTMCDGAGDCLALPHCGGVTCDTAGRCWARDCPCARPKPSCTPAPLTQLNRADFVGSPVNGRDDEGAFDLDFDRLCTAYVATNISGPDYLRQLTPAGKLTQWTSTTNLNMGEVAVLLRPAGHGKPALGKVAATYICCATCGCVETGKDGRQGVIRLDRTSTTRPLPNVLPATPTTGKAPFLDYRTNTGPYGLTWGADGALYVGNVKKNGDLHKAVLSPPSTSQVATFPARVVASAVYDMQRLLVATEGKKAYLLTMSTGKFTQWATLAGEVTSMARDWFTGKVYAELNTKPPVIVAISEDGQQATTFQKPPRLGRIAIAPDGYLYHLSVYPAVKWKAKTAIVRWPLPAKR